MLFVLGFRKSVYLLHLVFKVNNYDNTTALFDVSIAKFDIIQPAITCTKLTMETLEQGVKYVQS